MSEYCVRVGIARNKVFVLKKNHPMKRRNHGGCEHLVNREWNSDEKTRDTNHTGDGTGDHRRSIVWTSIYSEQIALPENVGETTLNPLVNDHFPKNGH